MLEHKPTSKTLLRETLFIKRAVNGGSTNAEHACTSTSRHEKSVLQKATELSSIQNYSPTSLALMFLLFSHFGWLWEVALTFFETGLLDNRGMFHGPWLPIYGVGGILMLLLFKQFYKKPIIYFALCVLVCGIVEYATSWLLEMLLSTTWWDYSQMFLNLHGRIYLGGLLLFAAVGCITIYFFAPRVHNKVMSLSKKTRIALCVFFGIIFIIDMFFSFTSPNMGFGASMIP